jgi:hypothetical protein
LQGLWIPNPGDESDSLLMDMAGNAFNATCLLAAQVAASHFDDFGMQKTKLSDFSNAELEI